MHLQTIIHSVAIFGIENAAAHFQDSRAKFTQKRNLFKNKLVCSIARRISTLSKASAAQAVAAFFTRVFYHTPQSLSSTFYAVSGKNITNRSPEECSFVTNLSVCFADSSPKKRCHETNLSVKAFRLCQLP